MNDKESIPETNLITIAQADVIAAAKAWKRRIQMSRIATPCRESDELYDAVILLECREGMAATAHLDAQIASVSKRSATVL